MTIFKSRRPRHAASKKYVRVDTDWYYTPGQDNCKIRLIFFGPDGAKRRVFLSFNPIPTGPHDGPTRRMPRGAMAMAVNVAVRRLHSPLKAVEEVLKENGFRLTSESREELIVTLCEIEVFGVREVSLGGSWPDVSPSDSGPEGSPQATWQWSGRTISGLGPDYSDRT